MTRARLAAATAALALIAGVGRADEVTDRISQALAAYQRRDMPTALAALDAASALLRRLDPDRWKDLFPPPPDGWTADGPQGPATERALLKGGAGISRRYERGIETVEISVLTDAPMVRAMATLIGNPLLSGGAGLVEIDGRRFAYARDDNAYMTLAGDKALLRIRGSEAVNDATLRRFAAALDYGAIEAAVK